MTKYWHVILVGLQNTLVYRINFFLRSVFALIPLAAIIFFWKAVYANGEIGGQIAGHTLAEMISYYLLITLIDMLTAVNEDDWQIASDIRDGNINQFLVRPINYMVYRFCLFGAGRLIYTAVALAPVIVFMLLQRQFFVGPASEMALVLSVLSLVMTALLQFFLSFTVAMLAFWVLEVSTFIFIVFAFEYVAGGHLFPLDILPPVVTAVLKLTPFPYLMFFPASIYLGWTTEAEIWKGLGIQLFWVVFFFIIARFVWSRGLRKYTAVGG